MSDQKRTTAQTEADKIDLAIYQLANRIERFAQSHARIDDRDNIDRISAHLHGLRGPIRAYMHEADRKETA